MEGVRSGGRTDRELVRGRPRSNAQLTSSAASASRFDSESQRVDGKLFEPVVRQVHRRQIGEARERVGRQFRDDIEVGLDLKCGERRVG